MSFTLFSISYGVLFEKTFPAANVLPEEEKAYRKVNQAWQVKALLGECETSRGVMKHIKAGTCSPGKRDKRKRLPEYVPKAAEKQKK